jgi:hypothetical protein
MGNVEEWRTRKRRCWYLANPLIGSDIRKPRRIDSNHGCLALVGSTDLCVLFAENEVLADKIIPKERGANRAYFGDQNLQP